MERSQEIKIKAFTGIILLLLIFIGGTLFWGYNNLGNYRESVKLNKSLNDTLRTYVGKDGENRARISRIETARAKDFLAIRTKDTEIIFLQGEVKRYMGEIKNGGSVTVVEVVGDYDTTVPTIVEITKDPKFPIYSGDSKDAFGEWAHITSRATKDSTTYKFTTKDKFTAVLGEEPTGFLGLGSGKPFVDITNHNPYSTTKSVRTYSVSDKKPKRFAIGATGAFGATYLNGNIGIGGTVGIGGTYTFIRF